MDKPYPKLRWPVVPPTHWICECGRRFIGDTRIFGHQDRGNCHVASGHAAGWKPWKSTTRTLADTEDSTV